MLSTRRGRSSMTQIPGTLGGGNTHRTDNRWVHRKCCHVHRVPRSFSPTLTARCLLPHLPSTLSLSHPPTPPTHTHIQKFILQRNLTTGAEPSKTELNHKTGPDGTEKEDEGEAKYGGEGAERKPAALRHLSFLPSHLRISGDKHTTTGRRCKEGQLGNWTAAPRKRQVLIYGGCDGKALLSHPVVRPASQQAPRTHTKLNFQNLSFKYCLTFEKNIYHERLRPK